MLFHLFQAQRAKTNHARQIAGVIGTGLFLGLGQLLATTGPLGVLLVFLLVGSVAFAFVLSDYSSLRSEVKVARVFSSIVSITEMTVFAPISGSFSHYGG
jgi:yeast amino acid transporter